MTLTGGSGTGAVATFNHDANGLITGLTVTNAGSGYKAGDLLTGTKATGLAATVATGSAVANGNTNVITYTAMNAGDIVTLGGLTFTAAQNLTAVQVAAAIGSGTVGTTANGTIAGTVATDPTSSSNFAAILTMDIGA